MIDVESITNQIINADCMDILKELPDKCIDLVLTDPPYGIGDKFRGGKNSKLNKFNKIVNKGWDNAPSLEYFNEIFRVSKNQIIFGGNYFKLPPTRCFLVWDKQISFDFSLAMAEYVWTSFDKVAKIYRISSEKQNRIHETQKPLKLIQMILNDYSNENDLILDCFSGSGTTAVACHNLKRRFICIEKDKDYFGASVERLKNVQAQMKLF
jgi:site-specific DNA-methyltransferase (adenine-specific)